MPNLPTTDDTRNPDTARTVPTDPPDPAPLPDPLPAMLKAIQEQIRELRGEIEALRSARHPDALLTRQETADRLNISTRTLDDLAADGQIKPTRIRGCVRYHPDTVTAFIRSQTEREGRR